METKKNHGRLSSKISWDSNIDQDLLARRFVSEISKSDGHITLKLTSEGVSSLIKGIQNLVEEGKIKRSIPAIDGLIPRKEVILRLGISPGTLYNWKKDGVLTPVKVGKKVFYRQEEVNAIEVR